MVQRRPPRRKPRASPTLTRFSFVNSYSIIGKNENPLVTGEVEEIDMTGLSDDMPTKGPGRLNIDLYDLVKAKEAFTSRGGNSNSTTDTELTLPQFIATFGRLIGSGMREQLGYLFMKIDCNCDGRVTWDELLTYVLSQERNESKPQLLESQLVRADIPDCPSEDAHREPATMAVFAPKCASYVSAGRDGTVRVWSTALKLQNTFHISDSKATAVQAMTLLPGTLSKLAVASADRIISLYELQDHVGAPRWSVHGRLGIKDMPASLAAWTHVSDGAHCFAIGTDTGSVPIFDAKKLVGMLKEERIKAEANRHGVIPLEAVERARIITLPLHTDWVTQLAYEENFAALVSSSLDSMLLVTQLDWPAAAVPSSKASESLLRADPAHCRNICSIRAHHKGVTSLQLMNVSSRKLCATCSYERDVCVWNIETGDHIKTLSGHRALLRQLAYDPISQVLVSLAADGEMRTWEMASYSNLQTIRAQNALDRIASVTFNVAQQCLVTTTRRLALWQQPRKIANQEVLNAQLLAPQGHCHPLVAVLFSSQFYLVVSGDESGIICVWDVRSGLQVFRFEHGSRLTAMKLDRTGRKLITGGADGEMNLWNFSSGEKLKTISSCESSQVEISAVLHIQLVSAAQLNSLCRCLSR